jgi:hypothetical protein
MKSVLALKKSGLPPQMLLQNKKAIFGMVPADGPFRKLASLHEVSSGAANGHDNKLAAENKRFHECSTLIIC